MADPKKRTGASKGGAGKKPAARKEPEPSLRAAAANPLRGRSAAALEEELAEARQTIEALAEDRDAQLAIAEAAEMEREQLEQSLEEALRKIKELEARSGGSGPSTEISSPEVPLPFDDEEEEEPSPRSRTAEPDDEDDAIYDRMNDPRVRRQELDRERLDHEGEYGDEPFWMTCPKCGDHLEETDAEDVKLERCEGCGGIYLDSGEVQMLLSLAGGRDGLRRVRDVLEM
jgi:hypothetical protein